MDEPAQIFPMKFPLGWLVTRAHRRSAFTLIELLTVMAIILILAGLIISIAGSASYNSARSRATGEIKAMETALESYKTDNGAYPSDSTNANGGSQATTEVLDAQNTGSYSDPSTYLNSSEFLYQALSGFQLPAPGGTGTVTVTKPYMAFKPDQLHAAANAPGAATTTASPTSPYNYIIDPFGFSYGYSTIYAKVAASNSSQNPPVTTPVTNGYNPTFDLWSTAGYANGGKTIPTSMPAGMTQAAFYSSLWVKNW